MQEQDDIQKELADLSPQLAKLRKETQADIPLDYFNTLPDTVWDKVQSKTETKQVTISRFPRVIGAGWDRYWESLDQWLQSMFQPRVALVFASLLLLLTAGYWLKTNDAFTQESLAELTTEEIDWYVSENIEDFEQALLEVLPEDIDLSMELNEIDDAELDDLMDDLLNDIDENDLEEFL